MPGHLHVAASDEHDEDGVLISDVYTDTVRRKKMADKRSRKMATVLEHLPAPKLEGPRYQCPVIILSDLLMAEGNETVDPALLDVEFQIDRGDERRGDCVLTTRRMRLP